MNIVVIFGGESVEHDVSILTGLHAAKNLPKGVKYKLVYITRKGEMLAGGVLAKVGYYTGEIKKNAKKCWFADKALCTKSVMGVNEFKIDAVLNCCHGGVGEDGRLAGMFDVLGIPVTSCGTRAGLDLQSKSRTREVLTKAGFSQPKYKVIRKDGKAVKFDLPCIVKPDTLGSSIGISVAKSRGELDDAVELAFKMDDVAIVETFLQDATEVNCAVFKVAGRVITSACEVIKKSGAMFDFNTKYLDSDSGFVKSRKSKEQGAKVGGRVVYDAELAQEVTDEIKKLAARAYELFGAKGVIRADFLIAGGKIYLNEINTVPGFLSYHLWQGAGLSYATLLQMMLDEAVAGVKKDLETAFSSDILQKNRVLVE